MNKFTEILSAIEEEKSWLDKDLDYVPGAYRQSTEARQNQAKRQLEDLKLEFRREFVNVVAKMFVTGPVDKINKFADFFSREGAGVFSADNMYKLMAEEIMPGIRFGTTFGINSYMQLLDVINNVARSLNVYAQNDFKEPSGVVINSLDDLVNTVKTVVRGAFDDRLNCTYILHRISNEALNVKFNNKFAVLVIPNASLEEKSVMLDSLFPGQPNFTLEIGEEEEPDKSMAMKIYNKISSTFFKLGKISTKTETNKDN
jgi:hypothetical protein